MKLAANVKPVGYLKENADEIVRTLSERGGPLIITRDGEAKAVIQDIKEFERTQETLTLLKILSLGRKQIEEGRVRQAAEVVFELRESLKDPR
ncbi:type II toxin-antitoxin system Phd/YefM family antitoxin [Aminivibrio sp.]|jgi:prevent-host-death family protein|uniref:type II toxin-antitoxin system Phd/YefM family antitoxin n=1 Tax=Aminivibrio sp. TaxID=1872489 RepID=UPI001A583B01|nr:type II toxin-antitoxin system Phd/YefM family antitoxin [Aminivibrio sp.]MBL3539463.1 type II toxin-antitoxin system Phd/YefM family antitoxin [Aminivibrio sp.]